MDGPAGLIQPDPLQSGKQSKYKKRQVALRVEAADCGIGSVHATSDQPQ
jgi:hypothetical protein